MNILHTVLEADVHLIKLSRPLQASLAEEMGHVLQEIARQGAKKVVINLEDVPFIDSRGLAALVAGLKILGGAQNLRLAAPQAQPKLLFELTMFDRIFQIFDSVAAATAAA